MPHEEVIGTRRRDYSAWHRRNSTRRFVGIELAQLLAMIDLDASLYVEYDDGTKEPLALIETAIDNGQSYKTATVTCNLAKKANLPCYVVLCKLSDVPNPADPEWQDIESFRIKRLWPKPESKWRTLTPQQWAEGLVQMRRWQAGRIDSLFTDTHGPNDTPTNTTLNPGG
jgi:hypothetical protein